MEDTLVYRNLRLRLGTREDWPAIEAELRREWTRMGGQWKSPHSTNLDTALVWRQTFQGTDYWHNLHNEYIRVVPGDLGRAPPPPMKKEKKYAAIFD